MNEKILAWHFLPNDCRMTNGDGRMVEAGKTYTHDGEIELCRSGLHASVNIIDALRYAPGPVLCRVEMGGRIIKGSDKIVASERKVIWMMDVEKLLLEFACRCAERAVEKHWVPIYPEDKRPQQAIAAIRAWLRGEIGSDEMTTTASAAYAAASAASAAASAAYASARAAASAAYYAASAASAAAAARAASAAASAAATDASAAASAAYASARAAYYAASAASASAASAAAAARAASAAASAAYASARAAERELQEAELLKMIEDQRSLK